MLAVRRASRGAFAPNAGITNRQRRVRHPPGRFSQGVGVDIAPPGMQQFFVAVAVPAGRKTLNPFAMLTKNRPHLESVGWNPLLQLNPGSPDFEGDAMCIADAIVEKSSGSSGGEGGKFFERSAQNLVQALLMWERISKGEAANLRNIPTLLNDPDTYDPTTTKLNGGFTFALQNMAACNNYVIQNTANG